MFLIFFGIRYILTPQNTALMSPFRHYSNRRHRTSIGVPLKKLFKMLAMMLKNNTFLHLWKNVLFFAIYL